MGQLEHRSVKHDSMKRANLLNLLDVVRNHGPLTKKDIQAKSGLSWGAVSGISAELLAKKILTEEKESNGAMGRTPALLNINGEDNLIVGLDINVSGLTALVTDLKCGVRYKDTQTLSDFHKDAVLSRVGGLISSVLNNARQKKILGIGVAMQGSVDAKNGISRFSPFFDGWRDVPLQTILEDATGLPVMVAHDPNCTALAEKWVGCAQSGSDFLLIRMSFGIGMGIVQHGEIYDGYDGAAGEVGHMTVEPGGEPCPCGSRGCLEMYCSGRGVLRQLEKRGVTGVSVKEAAEEALIGREPYKCVFEDAGRYLGLAAVSLNNLFNPQFIVISGDLPGYQSLMLPSMNETLLSCRGRFAPVNLLESSLSDAAALGAAVLIAQKIFSGQDIKIL